MNANIKKSILHFPLILLLLSSSCHTPGSKDDNQLQSFAVADTLLEPTGNAKLDSLLQLAVVARSDTSLALLYYEIGDVYYFNLNDFEKAKEYYLTTGTLSEQLDWNRGRYLFSAGFTDVLNRHGMMDSSIVIHKQVLEILKKENDEQLIAIATANIANCYLMKKWYETALTYFNEALSIFEKRNEKYRLAHIYDFMGIAFDEMEMYDEKQMYCEKALEIWNDKPDTLLRASVLNNYAVALLATNQFKKAEESLLEAQRICLLHGNKSYLSTVYNTLGNLSLKRYELDKAEIYAHKALEFAAELGEVENYCAINRTLAYVEEYRRNFDKSEEYVREALKTAIEYDLPREKAKCYDLLSELSIARHDFRNHRFFRTNSDSIHNEIVSEKSRIYAKEMEARYETEKKEREIERQQSIIARQNMQRGLLVGGVAICVVFLALLWYMLRLRNRRNDALTERNNMLSEMNSTKDKFFNIISHDLKNPTLALNDNLKVLVHNVRVWDAERLADFSAELLKSTEGQVELLNSLLNWARIQTGRITCIPVTFDLAVRLRNEIALVRKMAENKGITLDFQMPDDAPVTGDGNMLVTVVRNLLINAIKFTASGGTVMLSVSPISPTTPVSHDKYLVSVTDTGTGMSEEQIQNLFRLDKPQTRRGTADEEGSGLGLIVCKELLGMHNSVLQVESEEGKGSRFWFELKIG